MFFESRQQKIFRQQSRREVNDGRKCGEIAVVKVGSIAKLKWIFLG